MRQHFRIKVGPVTVYTPDWDVRLTPNRGPVGDYDRDMFWPGWREGEAMAKQFIKEMECSA